MKPNSPNATPEGTPAGVSDSALVAIPDRQPAPTAAPPSHVNGRFAKGNTVGRKANPAGRKKGSRSLNDALRRRLQRPLTRAELEGLVVEYDLPKTLADALFLAEDRLDALAEIIIHKAMTGNVATFQEIFDRLAPKKASIELSGGPAPIRLVAVGQGGDEAQAADAYFTEMRGEGQEEG